MRLYPSVENDYYMKCTYLLAFVLFSCGISFASAPEKTYLYIKDHLGSIRGVVDRQTGELVERSSYDPLGTELENTHVVQGASATTETYSGKPCSNT